MSCLKGDSTMTRFNLNTLTPYSVGFDRMFDRLLEQSHQHPNNQGFPPYNIRRDDEKFYIDIALAGLNQEDIDIEHKENTLTVKSAWDESSDDNVTGEYLHRGISRKKFTRSFTLADDIEVRRSRVCQWSFNYSIGTNYSRREKTQENSHRFHKRTFGRLIGELYNGTTRTTTTSGSL